MFVFRKNWRDLFSWNTRFEIRPFALLPTIEFAVIMTVNFFTKQKFLELEIILASIAEVTEKIS